MKKYEDCVWVTCRPCCCGPCVTRIYKTSSGITFTVTYIANGGTGEYSDRGLPQDYFYTVKSGEQTGIFRSGYALAGWNTAPDGSGETFKPDMSLNLTENLVLYAQWETV